MTVVSLQKFYGNKVCLLYTPVYLCTIKLMIFMTSISYCISLLATRNVTAVLPVAVQVLYKLYIARCVHLCYGHNYIFLGQHPTQPVPEYA